MIKLEQPLERWRAINLNIPAIGFNFVLHGFNTAIVQQGFLWRDIIPSQTRKENIQNTQGLKK